MNIIVMFEFLRRLCAPIYVSIFLDISSEIHSPCIVSLSVITCQLQTPSRQLTAIRGNSSQYDVARIPIDWYCFFLARIRREIIARKIERKRADNCVHAKISPIDSSRARLRAGPTRAFAGNTAWSFDNSATAIVPRTIVNEKDGEMEK